jgi:prepilin-type N-terminal cleavage/methylation domain-containing protein
MNARSPSNHRSPARPEQAPGPRDRREGGFTLIEVMIALLVLATAFIVVGGALISGVRRTAEMKERNLVVAQAWKFAERLQRIPYGSEILTPATAEQLDDLFDDDGDLGNVTLYQVQTPVGSEGLRFRLSGFEVEGDWEIQVNEDLNGDGDTDDHNEGTGCLTRIEILFRGQTVLRTFRARPAEST